MVDLGEVVVFRGQPEDGYMRMPGGCGLAGTGNGCGGLEGNQKRPAKKPHLLAGDNGSRSLGQGRKCACVGGVLRGEQPNQLGPVCRKSGALLPAIGLRGRCKKRLRRRSPGTVVEKQPAHSRHHGHGITVCGRQLVHFRDFGFFAVRLN